VEGSDEVKLRAFREAFTVLARRIDLLLALPADKLDRLRLERRVREIGSQ
jgi:arsenate reductase